MATKSSKPRKTTSAKQGAQKSNVTPIAEPSNVAESNNGAFQPADHTPSRDQRIEEEIRIRAYELFEQTFRDFQRLYILSYASEAESLFQEWRQQGIRISTHDLRIAAICVAHSARLLSRNRRDFERVPGLIVEFWD